MHARCNASLCWLCDAHMCALRTDRCFGLSPVPAAAEDLKKEITKTESKGRASQAEASDGQVAAEEPAAPVDSQPPAAVQEQLLEAEAEAVADSPKAGTTSARRSTRGNSSATVAAKPGLVAIPKKRQQATISVVAPAPASKKQKGAPTSAPERRGLRSSTLV